MPENPHELPPAKGVHWKYRARLALVPPAARILRAGGMAWAEIGRRLGRESLVAQVRDLASAPRPPAACARPLDVVFLTMMAGNQRIVGSEVVLARALRARGHRVRMVLCDQVLPICEVRFDGQEGAWDNACGKCYAFGGAVLDAAGLEVLPASALAAAAAGAEAGEDERWRDTVDAALLKHYRVGVLPADPRVEERRELYRQSARVSASVGRGLAALRPDLVVMSHGIYCTWGPQRDLLEEAGVPIVTYSEGKKKEAVKFNWTTSADWWDVSAEWARVRDVPLTAEQEARLDAYLDSRRSHANDVRVYNFGGEEPPQRTRERLGLDPDKPTFTLFTNVLWDAASAQREIAFANPVEWVMETIAWFAAHPDRQLVVKIHPAEVVIGTRQPFASLIADRFPSLPANVRVIEPHETVNSWSILRVTDLGLVHTSTVGMELPLEGVPCVVVSRTHFRGRGFTVDVESRDEYFGLLEEWVSDPADRARERELARRYAYLLFERYHLPFPFLEEPVVNDVRALRGVTDAELLAHPTLRILIGALEARQDSFLAP